MPIHQLTDGQLSEIFRPTEPTQYERLIIYLENAALDHGRRALKCFEQRDVSGFCAHKRGYEVINKALVAVGVWPV